MPSSSFFIRCQHVAVLSFSLLFSTTSSAQKPDQIQSNHLLRVNLLFVGAHPDDESGVTATFAREVLDHGARAAVVLATVLAGHVAAQATSWPMYRAGPARTASTQARLSAKMSLKWRHAPRFSFLNEPGAQRLV